MTFKIEFYLNLLLDEKRKCKKASLRRTCHLPFVPTEGMKIIIDRKKHRVKDVIYEMNNDLFVVELHDDNSYRFGNFNVSFEDILHNYIKAGWEDITFTPPVCHKVEN